MVIVRIRSGLGNQLFQYSTARHLAHKNNVRLKLDISSYESDPFRLYMLAHFNIQADIATQEEIDLFAKTEFTPGSYSDIPKLRVKEEYYHFDPRILDLRGDIYLEGHWQSERYFKDIEPIIRRELVLTSIPDASNQEMARRIRSTDSVSLHIRRGDYASEPGVLRVHGVLPLEYYYAAIERIEDIVERPHFFVFSDDPTWAQTNIKLEHPTTVVTINSINEAHEDLRLMSLCKNHIIANSTFGWWGAWLSQQPGKKVFAPRSWFRRTDVDTSDLIPASWFRL